MAKHFFRRGTQKHLAKSPAPVCAEDQEFNLVIRDDCLQFFPNDTRPDNEFAIKAV